MESKGNGGASRQILVRNVNKQTHHALKNIAAHHGLPMQKVVGMNLIKLIEAYPDDLKAPPTCTETQGKLAINGLPAKTREHAENIAAHFGISLSEFLKPLLGKISDAYPPYMKAPMHE